MDYYSQPRPVLYGVNEEESPPQTQTAPVRSGPPRYPPAPPLAGDAPDPFGRFRVPQVTLTNAHLVGTALALLYVVGSAYSLVQAVLDIPGSANHAMGRMALLIGFVISLMIVPCSRWLGRRGYRVDLGLVALHISLAVALEQWQSPSMWVAIAVFPYFLVSSVRKQQFRRAVAEVRCDIVRYGGLHRRCAPSLFRRVLRTNRLFWRNS